MNRRAFKIFTAIAGAMAINHGAARSAHSVQSTPPAQSMATVTQGFLYESPDAIEWNSGFLDFGGFTGIIRGEYWEVFATYGFNPNNDELRLFAGRIADGGLFSGGLWRFEFPSGDGNLDDFRSLPFCALESVTFTNLSSRSHVGNIRFSATAHPCPDNFATLPAFAFASLITLLLVSPHRSTSVLPNRRNF